MTAGFFTAMGEPDPDGRQGFSANHACIGPWSADAMHGGPPSALLVRACELAAERAAGDGWIALRVALDFFSPVPMGDVEVLAEVLRPGRRIALTGATLSSGGRAVLQARTWLVRPDGNGGQAPPDLASPDPDRPAPQDCAPTMGSWDFPYRRALDWRLASGNPEGPGDAACWARQLIPLVTGEQPSGLQRVVLVADSGNGISAALDWDRWMFVNIDLAVHLARPVAGEWVLLDARTRYTAAGTGLATSLLRDERGVVGAGAQSLLILPR